MYNQPINFNEICLKKSGESNHQNEPTEICWNLDQNPQKSAGFFTRMNPQKSVCQVFDLLFRDITPEDYETLLRLDESVSRWIFFWSVKIVRVVKDRIFVVIGKMVVPLKRYRCCLTTRRSPLKGDIPNK